MALCSSEESVGPTSKRDPRNEAPNAHRHRPVNSRCSNASCGRWAGGGATPGLHRAAQAAQRRCWLHLRRLGRRLRRAFGAHALPQPEGRHIQELVRSYAEVVVEEEWPLMAQGRSSPKAWATLDELRGTILGLNPPKGAKQIGYDQMRYNEMLVQLHDLGNARRERLLAARQGLPPILWIVLILG